MTRWFERSLRVLALLLALLAGAPPASLDAAQDRKTLVLRGRVTDAEGWPVAGARVVARGTRRASATADEGGQFALQLPLGSPAALVSKPLAVRVHAERRGWRLALPSGEAEVGLELRLVADADGVVRCEVRSNQPKVASAVVRALTATGNATGVAIVNFIGARGEAIGSPPPVDMPLVDRVALAGVRVPAAPRSEAARSGEARLEKRPVAAAREETAKPKPAKPEPAPPKAATGRTAAPARPGPGATPGAVTPSEAERELAASKGRASHGRSLAREEAKRLLEETRERDRLAKVETEARAKEEERARRAAEEELKRVRAGQQQRWDALRREVHMIAGSTDTTAPPQAAALDRLAGTPSHADQRSRILAPPRLVPRRDTVAVRPPQPLPEPPPVAATTTPAAAGRGSGASPIIPRPEGESRARARPLVIRTPGVRPAAAAASPAAGDSCACRIEGTVEVDSQRPLPDRTRVAVSLVWYPAIADTVELFMGSPRSFSLPVAPCGPQRLRLVNLSLMRFDVISREAMAGFHCQPGTLRQFRLVLEPR